MRYQAKHKCGMVRDSKHAWKAYPVTDCASCMVTVGKPAEAPSQELRPATKPELAENPFGVVTTPQQDFATRMKERWERRRSFERRRTMLTLLVFAQGPVRIARVQALMRERFGVEMAHNRIYEDLQRLVMEKFLVVEQVPREFPLAKHHRATEGLYRINPALREKVAMGDE